MCEPRSPPAGLGRTARVLAMLRGCSRQALQPLVAHSCLWQLLCGALAPLSGGWEHLSPGWRYVLLRQRRLQP